MKKTSFHLFFLLFFIFATTSLKALSYNSNLKARLIINSLQKKPILDGSYNNSLEINDIIFAADIMVDDDQYLYDLSTNNNKLINFYSNLYLGYNVNDNNQIYFGYLPSVGSNYFYYNTLNRYPNFFGIKGIKKFNFNAVNNDNSYIDKYYVISNSFLNNNSALSTAYRGNFLDNKINLGISYTFDMNTSLRNYNQNKVQGFTSPLDLNIIYYDEYLDLGYGAKASLRKFIDGDNSKFVDESAVGIIIDYFGASYQLSVLKGYNKIHNMIKDNTLTNINYIALENNFNYSLLAFNFGLYTLSSIIKTPELNYKTNLTEFNVKYQLSNYLYLTGNVFYQNTFIKNLSNLKNDTGVVFGLMIDY